MVISALRVTQDPRFTVRDSKLRPPETDREPGWVALLTYINIERYTRRCHPRCYAAATVGHRRCIAAERDVYAGRVCAGRQLSEHIVGKLSGAPF